MSEQEIKDTLADIKEMILADKNYFDKVKTDLMYDNIRPHVNILLEDIFREKKEKVEKELFNVEFAAQRMKKWFDAGYATINEKENYKKLIDNVSDVKNKQKRQSYIDYVDGFKILYDSKDIIQNIHKTIKNDIDNSANMLKNNIILIKEIPEKHQSLNIKKVRQRIIGIGELFILFIAINIIGTMMHTKNFLESVAATIAVVIVFSIILAFVGLGLLLPGLTWFLISEGIQNIARPGRNDIDSQINNLNSQYNYSKDEINNLEIKINAGNEALEYYETK